MKKRLIVALVLGAAAFAALGLVGGAELQRRADELQQKLEGDERWAAREEQAREIRESLRPMPSAQELASFVELAKVLYHEGQRLPPLPLNVCYDGPYGVWDTLAVQRPLPGDNGVTRLGTPYSLVAPSCVRAIFKNRDDASMYFMQVLGEDISGFFNGAEGPAYDTRIELVFLPPGQACDWENRSDCPVSGFDLMR